MKFVKIDITKTKKNRNPKIKSGDLVVGIIKRNKKVTGRAVYQSLLSGNSNYYQLYYGYVIRSSDNNENVICDLDHFKELYKII